MKHTNGDRGSGSTGIAALDDALEGLYWGDSVVWELEESASADSFYEAAARAASGFHYAAYVTVTEEPAWLEGAGATLDVIDARPGSPLASPEALLHTFSSRCSKFDRDLLLFEGLDPLADAWGAEAAAEFFASTCSLLLELGAIAYWTYRGARHPALRHAVRHAPQCAIALSDERLRIKKAEGRGPGIEGRIYRHEPGPDGVTLTPAPTLARLGEALRAVRADLGLTQSDVARLAGVTASAVSQAERGHRGLSLETLLELTDKLGLGIDDFLRGKVRAGYRLARRHDPRERGSGHPLTLLDDEHSGYRIHAIYLPPHGTATNEGTQDGVELVTVASGLVQVLLPSASPVLRQGEALLVEDGGVYAWRNLCDREAMLFWITRAERPPSGEAASERALATTS
jgi:transcriptional regulator with XRE-family HTH domain